MSYMGTFDSPVIDDIKKLAQQPKKKVLVNYPELLIKIVRDKQKYKEMCDNHIPKRDRKLFRRQLNKNIKLFNSGIKVIKVAEV